jgi:hypothetical protein
MGRRPKGKDFESATYLGGERFEFTPADDSLRKNDGGRPDQSSPANQGDAFEPTAGGIVGADFPPAEPATPKSMAERAAPSTLVPPDHGEGKKEWAKSLTCITDPDTGMRFHFDFESHLGVITFVVEPSAAVKQNLSDGGYRYKPEVKAWLFPLTSGHWADDRKHAKKVFWQVNGDVRAEMGLSPFTQTHDQGPIPD